MNQVLYVIVTAAKNEGSYIGLTIESVARQSLSPKAWVIVSDNSTDDTDKIVLEQAKKYNFIRLKRKMVQTDRDFSSKVDAIKMGVDSISDTKYEYLGILDADISLPENYYVEIINRMKADSKIGIAGGILYELYQNNIGKRIASSWSVSGAIQVYRRDCFEDIGGLVPLRGGGEDTVAEIMARMKGWGVKSFEDVQGCHNRITGTAENKSLLGIKYSMGCRDYSYGTHPLYEILKCLRRIKERPFFWGALLRIVGFTMMYIKSTPRFISDEFIVYLRKEQMNRVRNAFHLGKIDTID